MEEKAPAKKEERRIIWIFGETYEVLKQREDGNGWHKPGERKTLGEIRDLFRSEKYAVTMEEVTFYQIRAYERAQEKRTEEYRSKKDLASKTI
jgi:hypothetical protein